MDSCQTLPAPIPLRRRWRDRLLDRVADARAWLRAAITRWRERQAVQDAMDLDEATLRDMGMPLWMQEEARARREQRDLNRQIDRLGGSALPERFY